MTITPSKIIKTPLNVFTPINIFILYFCFVLVAWPVLCHEICLFAIFLGADHDFESSIGKAFHVEGHTRLLIVFFFEIGHDLFVDLITVRT